MSAIVRSVAAALLVSALIGPATPVASAAVVPSRIHLGLTLVASGLSQPLLVTNAGDGSALDRASWGDAKVDCAPSP